MSIDQPEGLERKVSSLPDKLKSIYWMTSFKSWFDQPALLKAPTLTKLCTVVGKLRIAKSTLKSPGKRS